MLESPNSRIIVSALCRSPLVRLFRNNVGKGWVSNCVRKLRDGSVLLEEARRIAFGLFAGSGDWIGWTTVTITPEMVGTRVAVFTSIETKRAKGGVRKANQLHWVATVQKAGGKAGFAENIEQAQKITGVYES